MHRRYRLVLVWFAAMISSGCTLESIDPVGFGEPCKGVARAVSVTDESSVTVYCAGEKDDSGFCSRYRKEIKGESAGDDAADYSIIVPLNSDRCPADFQCMSDSGENICFKSKCLGANVNIFADSQNCGACGNSCGNGKTCQNGQCVNADSSKVLCDGMYIDPNTHAAFCGAKGNCSEYEPTSADYRGFDCTTMPGRRLCSNGLCVSSCPNGQSLCMNRCVSLANGNIVSCALFGVTCKEGNYAQCDEILPKCMDLSQDSNNCGACGKKCDEREVCLNGVCLALGCADEDQELCVVGGINTCIDINGANEDHCGACNRKCADLDVPNAAANAENACNGGKCRYVCAEGYENVGDDDSYEGILCVDINADAGHCGAKGNACDDKEVCINGGCVVNSCKAPKTLCPVNGANICKDTQGIDADHCGKCNYKCSEHPVAHAESSGCSGGACQYACEPEYANVGTGATADTIKCVDFKTDNNNCGVKGNICKDGKICIGGSCEQNACPYASQSQCLVNGSIKCIDTKGNDADHCGVCNHKCADHPLANAVSSACSDGECQYVCTGKTTNRGTGTTSSTILCY